MTSALVPNFSAPLQAHGDVGVAAQMALLHIAGGDFDELQHLLDFGEIGEGFVGGAHVGLADDFDQRRAAAVEIDVGVAVGILETVVHALAGVVFHVDAGDADALAASPSTIDIDKAVFGERLIVLRDLVALGQIGIEVVLAREAIDSALTVQLSASAALMASSTAWRLSTGSAPGKPRQTGQTLVFGAAPKLVGQPQKILVRVAS